MDKKVVVRIDGKVCALTIILAIAFSSVLTFSMYKLIEHFYVVGATSCTIVKFMFLVYPIIFLAVAFTLAGYLMIVGSVDDSVKTTKKGKKK